MLVHRGRAGGVPLGSATEYKWTFTCSDPALRSSRPEQSTRSRPWYHTHCLRYRRRPHTRPADSLDWCPLPGRFPMSLRRSLPARLSYTLSYCKNNMFYQKIVAPCVHCSVLNRIFINSATPEHQYCQLHCRLQMKFREGNVLTGICLFTGVG